MGIVVWIYLAGLALVAIMLGYVMRTRLDEFDWMYHRNAIWLSYVVTLIFWPIVLLFKPRLLFSGGEQLFVVDTVLGGAIPGIAQRMRRLKQFSDFPSPCGNTLYYRHEEPGAGMDKGAKQWFEADDITSLYKGKTLPLYSDAERVALVSWITNRDQTIELPTEVPELINFQNVAVSLLDAGYGHIECVTCATRYRASELGKDAPLLHVGWNKATYLCPKGHALLKHDYVHIIM